MHRVDCPTIVPTHETQLQPGDVVVAVGDVVSLDRALALFGSSSDQHVEFLRERVDMRRILVSRRQLVGKALAELDLEARFNAQVTRLRRADVDIFPSRDTRLLLGDRLRVVAPAEHRTACATIARDTQPLRLTVRRACAAGARGPICRVGTTFVFGV